MDFVTIDVETANNDVGSICQVGLAKYINHNLVGTYSTLVMPEGDFGYYNTKVHGLTLADVIDAPMMIDVYSDILEFISSNILISYSKFDKRSLKSCANSHCLPAPTLMWVDALAMLRRYYPQYSKKGAALNNVCEQWGYVFKHHDALEDAKACGFVVSRIINENNVNVKDWISE